MGMYRGSFTVIDPGGSGDQPSAAAVPSQQLAVAGGGSCGGGGGCGCGGGGKQFVPQAGAVAQAPASDTQVLQASFTVATDLQPNTFTVKKGQPVELNIDAKEDGQGCMGSIMIRGLVQPQAIARGQMKLAFTPQDTGTYKITCAMGVPRGSVTVID
jgi:hypothetical protein